MRKTAIILFLAGAMAFTPSAAAIGAKDFFPKNSLPQAVRERLADRIIGRIRIRDPAFDDYFAGVRAELSPADDVLIITADADRVNAFAHYGGIIILMRGMWEYAVSEDGLLGIVAHEIAHVRLNHFKESKDLQDTLTAITVPLLIAGLLSDDAEVQEAVISGGTGIVTGQIYAHSRELEHEADVLGLKILLDNNRDGMALARMLGGLAGGGSEYISTHPAPARRAAYIRDRLLGIPPANRGDSLDFMLLREKLSVMHGLQPKLKEDRQKALPAAFGKQKTTLQFGLLHLANKTRDKKLGQEMFDALASSSHPFVAAERAEYISRHGDHLTALEILAAARNQHPQSAALAVRQLIIMRRAGKMREIIKAYNAMSPSLQNRPDILREASQALSSRGKNGQANLLLAKAHAAQGKFELAERQLTIAAQYKMSTKMLVEAEDMRELLKQEIRALKEQ